MREDQIIRLKELAEEVSEVFIDEADPRNWNGAGMSLAQMDNETRGNRYWDKKNAIQTGTLLARLIDLAGHDSRVGPSRALDEDDADKQIAKFEKKAKELIDAAEARTTH